MTAVPSLPRPTEAQPWYVADDSTRNLLHRILMMLMTPLGYDKSLQRQRGTVVVEGGNVGTVTAVTSLNNINGRNGDMLVNANINTAWALNVRSRIT